MTRRPVRDFEKPLYSERQYNIVSWLGSLTHQQSENPVVEMSRPIRMRS